MGNGEDESTNDDQGVPAPGAKGQPASRTAEVGSSERTWDSTGRLPQSMIQSSSVGNATSNSPTRSAGRLNWSQQQQQLPSVAFQQQQQPGISSSLLSSNLAASLGINPMHSMMQPNVQQITALLEQQQRNALLQHQLDLVRGSNLPIQGNRSGPYASGITTNTLPGVNMKAGGPATRTGNPNRQAPAPAETKLMGRDPVDKKKENPPAKLIMTEQPDGPEPFPLKLFRMLNEAEASGYSDTVCWMPSGETFSILDNYNFIREVAPKYFQHSRISSFTRQLQLYRFRRVVEAGNVDCYKHPDFRKDCPDDLYKIKRSKRKKPAAAAAAADSSNP